LVKALCVHRYKLVTAVLDSLEVYSLRTGHKMELVEYYWVLGYME